MCTLPLALPTGAERVYETIHCTHCGEDGTLVTTQNGGQHPECADVLVCENECCGHELDSWCTNDVQTIGPNDERTERCRACRVSA
jgi:hypothetical protein